MAFRITKVYTRNGDAGLTRLGSGETVRKDAVRIRAYGMVDELNSVIGLALSSTPEPSVAAALQEIQHQLFDLGGDLCITESDEKKARPVSVKQEAVLALEQLMDGLLENLKPLEDFILPGGTQVSAFLHQARCVCRRAESLLVELAQQEPIGEFVLQYINRLSDALFVLARYQNHAEGLPDLIWRKADKRE